ncbi:type I phosphomannose isomerase catalytic subunit [Rickettsiales bacterium LUAb2]
MLKSLYPIKFAPIFKQRIWGGKLINKHLPYYNLPKYDYNIGEIWQIVDRDEDQSIVENGYLQGLSISELRSKYGKIIFGNSFNIDQPFPLLIKIIDAGEDLSLQVHPKEEDLKYLPSGAAPKTEMWYILENEKSSEILLGLASNITKENFINNLHSINLKSLINIYQSSKHQSYFVKSGTIHAIGKGNLLLEIQQNSDTTYRVSDWCRIDKTTNKPRELHIQESLQSINFSQSATTDYIQSNLPEANVFKKQISPNNKYFTVYYCCIDQEVNYSITSEKCEIISVVEGEIVIICGNQQYKLKFGETYLLPANTNYQIIPVSKATFLLYNFM